jgi:cytochrome c oxidase subunit 3
MLETEVVPLGPDASAKLAHHFSTLEKQTHAARLGMWLFLATEVLLFGGLFVCYASYRTVYSQTFLQGTHHLSLALGTTNTVVLITSSFAVAASTYYARHNRHVATVAALGIASALAILFLIFKGMEWSEHFTEGAFPGKYYAFAEFQAQGANIFFTLYYLMTGLHAIHVTVGLVVLVWMAVLAARGVFSAEYHTPLELGGLYWHLVDVIWIFLYPLFYIA